jgi:hypothetical protein
MTHPDDYVPRYILTELGYGLSLKGLAALRFTGPDNSAAAPE